MITFSPTASWMWGIDGYLAEPERAGAANLLEVYGLLSGVGLVDGSSGARLLARRELSEREVMEARRRTGDERVLCADRVPVDGRPSAEVEEELVDSVRRSLRGERPVTVDASLTCGGMVCEGDRRRHRARLFHLAVGVSRDHVLISLSTYGDAWMSHDLRGRPQPEVHRANAPRLAAGLEAVAAFTGYPTEPDEATWFSVPTPTGMLAHTEDDGSPSDSWGRFEIPSRLRLFGEDRQRYGLPGYPAGTERPVRAIPVRLGERVVGYLWTDDAEAAGYAPCPEAGDDVFDVGDRWMERLVAAWSAGLTPPQAIAELVRSAPDLGLGAPDPAGEAGPLALAELRGLAESGVAPT